MSKRKERFLMRQLFMLECKKTVTSVVYWLFVAGIAVVFWLGYGNVDEEEISDASSPSSVFYCAQDGQYAVEKDDLSEKSGQDQMMLALTNKLLHSYRSNSYEYYPFGYIKEKVFSESEQNVVLKYLQEITGMDKAEIAKDRGESKESKESQDSSEVEISGEGAYVAKPGAGSMEETGKYVFQPGKLEYVENSSAADGKKEGAASKKNEEVSGKKERGEEFSIQVSFQRFMEIMDDINGMIGKDSYFSRALIELYYGANDLEDSPVTLKQHEEFYKRDKITGAFARYYCDSIALAVLLLPVFVITAVIAGDRRNKVMEFIDTKPVSGFKLIFTRYLANAGMMFLPILLLPLRSFFVLARYANASGYAIDVFAFPKYIIGWILPTLLFVTALSLFLAVLAGSTVSVLVMGVLLLFFKPSVAKIAGGNYELFDLAIRHNTLKGFGRMMQHFNMLVINRIFITGAAFLFVLLSVWIYQIKRRGGLSFHVREFIHYHKREL